MTEQTGGTVERLYATTDGMVWAEEFCKMFRVRRRWGLVSNAMTEDAEVGLMVGWFANAIEVGRTAGLSAETGRGGVDG